MKIKKYVAESEKEAINKVKQELGKEALILNIKRTEPKGFFKIFKKISVEVTAAVDERPIEQSQPKEQFKVKFNEIQDKELVKDDKIEDEKTIEIIKQKDENIKNLEEKISNLEVLISKSFEKLSKERTIEKEAAKAATKEKNDLGNDRTIINIFRNHMLDNEVSEEITERLLDGLENNNNINDVVKILYKRIIDFIGQPDTIKVNEEKPNVIFLIGPTGVGKTTTLAKIATYFSLNLNKKIGFITSDTYRIAAVEQLKIYAKILDIPVEVIYSPDEIDSAVNKLKDKDIVFVDTAGRSHKNEEQFDELNVMLNKLEKNNIYLVLSLTMKYKDMLKIIDKYSDISEYSVLFTKADETTSLGNVLNVKAKTGVPLSYLTFGQNVPDDIEVIDPQKIAKALLGGYEV